MKKIFIFVLLLLSTSVSWGASADPKDLPLLKRLNKAYYCLNTQGLKRFTCDGRMDLADWWSQSLLAESHIQGALYALGQTKFKVSYGSDGIKVDATYASSTGNEEWDKKIKGFREDLPVMLKGAFEIWNSFMMDPINTEQNFAECAYKVELLKDGYKIAQIFDDGNVITSRVDKNLKMLFQDYVEPNGETTTVRLKFTDTPQGYLLEETKVQTGSKSYLCKYKTALVGKYLLPETMEITTYSSNGEKKGGFIFSISNYKVRR